jgi:hypothetical protein
MQVGIKILKITLRAVGLAYEPEAKRLHGDRSTGFGIVIGYGLSQI